MKIYIETKSRLSTKRESSFFAAETNLVLGFSFNSDNNFLRSNLQQQISMKGMQK